MNTTAQGPGVTLVGGGIAALAAAVYLVRDGHVPCSRVRILEEQAFGGSLDCSRQRRTRPRADDALSHVADGNSTSRAFMQRLSWWLNATPAQRRKWLISGSAPTRMPLVQWLLRAAT
jgi:glycine/D-amino acid oxidase-like deaminating enzyme